MQKYQEKSYIFQHYFFVYLETDFIGEGRPHIVHSK